MATEMGMAHPSMNTTSYMMSSPVSMVVVTSPEGGDPTTMPTPLTTVALSFTPIAGPERVEGITTMTTQWGST